MTTILGVPLTSVEATARVGLSVTSPHSLPRSGLSTAPEALAELYEVNPSRASPRFNIQHFYIVHFTLYIIHSTFNIVHL